MKEFFNQIRLKFGFRQLKQELKKLNRKNRSTSLSNAQNIGVLINIQSQKQLQEVEDFAK